MSSVSTQAQLTLVDTNDLYLTKDPSLALFRQSYQTYTPLATQFLFHRPQGDVSGLPGETVSFSLRRTGDLLKNMFLRFRGPILRDVYPTTTKDSVLGSSSLATSTTDKRYQFLWGPLAYHAIDSVTMKLNSTTVDTLYGDWMYVWTECLTPSSNRAESKTLITKMSTPDSPDDDCNNEFFCLPIPFWFTTHPGLALPLVALSNTEIQITVTFAKVVNTMKVYNTTDSNGDPLQTNAALNSTALSSIELVTEEVSLCESERKWFATNPVSYLITQHDQRDETPFHLVKDDEPTNADVTLPLENFRLPIRQLWVGRGGLLCKSAENTSPEVVTFLTDNRLVSGCYFEESWIMNDSREITDRANLRQRSNLPFYQDGKHIGSSSSMKKQWLTVAGQDDSNDATLAVQPTLISFSMGLDDNHPQGAINFSRMKSPRLVLKGAKNETFPTALSGTYGAVESNYVVLAENYNVLDIRDGTAYLRFTD